MKHTGGIIEADIVTEGKAIQEEAGQAAAEEEEDDEFSREQNVLTDPTQELPGKSLDEIEVKTVDVSQYNTCLLYTSPPTKATVSPGLIWKLTSLRTGDSAS